MSSEGNDILEKRQMLSEKLQSILLCLFLLGSGGQRLQVTEGLNTMDLQWEIEVQPKNLFFLTQILRDCLLCQLKRKQKGHLELLFHIRRFWLCFWGSTSCTTYPFFWMHRRLMQTVSRLLKLQFNFTAKFIFTEIPQRCPIWVNTEGNRMKSPKVLSCFRDLTTGTLFTRISPLFFWHGNRRRRSLTMGTCRRQPAIIRRHTVDDGSWSIQVTVGDGSLFINWFFPQISIPICRRQR